MGTKIDSTNKEILRRLGKDGRKPFSVIADELKITENTVRSRVNKLIEDGTLEISGLIDPAHSSGLQAFFMGVRMKTSLDLGQKATDFSKLRGVVSAVVVTGRYDLIVQLILSEAEGITLLDFFKNELVKVKDIMEVETFLVYEACNHRVPYVL